MLRTIRTFMMTLVWVMLYALSSCAPVKYVAPSDSYILVRADDGAASSLTRAGLTISVEPANVPDLVDKAPQYCREKFIPRCAKVPHDPNVDEDDEFFASRTVDVNWNPGDDAYDQRVRTCAPLVDLAFVVRIKNDTSHAIDLGTAKMRLQERGGRVFYPVRVLGNCKGRARANETVPAIPDAWPGAPRVPPGTVRDTTAAFCFAGRYPKFPMYIFIAPDPATPDGTENALVDTFHFSFSGESVRRYLASSPDGFAEWTETPLACAKGDQFPDKPETESLEEPDEPVPPEPAKRSVSRSSSRQVLDCDTFCTDYVLPLNSGSLTTQEAVFLRCSDRCEAGDAEFVGCALDAETADDIKTCDAM